MKTSNLSLERIRNVLFIKMNLFLLGFFCIIALTGCSTYQFVYMDSNLPKNEVKEFIHETDSFSIKYSFTGENFALKMTIHNKLNQPIYIDWGKTTLFFNGSQEDGSFLNDNQVSFISPNSYTTVSSNMLMGSFVDPAPVDSLGNPEVSTSGNGKIHFYDSKNTPIFIHNILALTTHEDLTSPVFIDNSFWISEIYQTSNGPSTGSLLRANQFYFRKFSGFGKFMGYASLLGVAVIVAAFGDTGDTGE